MDSSGFRSSFRKLSDAREQSNLKMTQEMLIGVVGHPLR